MTENGFSAEMMKEREKQLMLALIDCAGEVYEINFTQNKIIGAPIQIVDGVEYSMLGQLGLPEDISFSEFIVFWLNKISKDEMAAFCEFFDIEKIKEHYRKGEHLLTHQYWTTDVVGNKMLALHKIRLYEDVETGDIMGISYLSDITSQDTLRKQEDILMEQFQSATHQIEMMERLSMAIPGGYHRCEASDGFGLQFVSQSFLDVVGWTEEELKTEFDNKYFNLVAPEDRAHFMSYEPQLNNEGYVELVYRIICKGGTRKWIQDCTKRIVSNGKPVFLCSLLDITDHVEKLNAEKEKAEASSLAKSTFLFNASHDIRTPMNAIQGFARIIQENVDNPEMVLEAVNKIMQSGDTLMTLINDVLEVSRIERGKDEVEEIPLNMETHVEKLHEMFAGEMEQAGITFKMENDIQHPNILGDNLKLTRIAMNLLSNAKKFTAPGGEVFFGVKESDYDGEKAIYTLTVRDNGIGMSQEFQKRAFEQFERERSSTESGVMGTGLGLAIIKKLTDLMGGECRIKSELGKGSEFNIAIPIKVAKEEALIHDITVDYSLFEGKRILLVEDNEFNREIAHYILEGANFVVEEAEDGSIAVNKLLKAEPGYFDVVLMDIQMPVMDGYKATKEIRNIADKRIANVPILAMTANAFEEDKRKCLEVGMNAHLGKPLDVDKLMQELAVLLQN